jgi:hypothetical protein
MEDEEAAAFGYVALPVGILVYYIYGHRLKSVSHYQYLGILECGGMVDLTCL